MSHRHLIVNIDRRQYLDPEKFGQGPAVLEWSFAGASILQGLALLTAWECAGARGFPSTRDVVAVLGTWAGTRTVIADDAGRPGQWLAGETRAHTFDGATQRNLYQHARATFTDISDAVIGALRSIDASHPLHDLDLSKSDRSTKTGYTPEEWAAECRGIEALRAALLGDPHAEENRRAADLAVGELTDLWQQQERRYAGDPTAVRRRVPPAATSAPSGAAAKFREQLKAKLEAARVAKQAEPTPPARPEPTARENKFAMNACVVNTGPVVAYREGEDGTSTFAAGKRWTVRGYTLGGMVTYRLLSDDGFLAHGVFETMLAHAPTEEPRPVPPSIEEGDTVETIDDITANDTPDLPGGHWRRTIKPGVKGTITKIDRMRDASGRVRWSFTAVDGRTAVGGKPLEQCFRSVERPPAPAPTPTKRPFAVGDPVVTRVALSATDRSVIAPGTLAAVTRSKLPNVDYSIEIHTLDGRTARFLSPSLIDHATDDDGPVPVAVADDITSADRDAVGRPYDPYFD